MPLRMYSVCSQRMMTVIPRSHGVPRERTAGRQAPRTMAERLGRRQRPSRAGLPAWCVAPDVGLRIERNDFGRRWEGARQRMGSIEGVFGRPLGHRFLRRLLAREVDAEVQQLALGDIEEDRV